MCAKVHATNHAREWQLARRLRLWELNSSFHCSVIGTCLTLNDLRGLAKKLHLKHSGNQPVDYELHGYFAHIAEERNEASKLLNKRLNQRHAASILRCRAITLSDDLMEMWSDTLNKGNIPGAYWAILTHPTSDQQLRDRMFADVHMLSHIVGASNRADIHRIPILEEQIKELERELSQRLDKYNQRLVQKDNEINILENKLHSKKNNLNKKTSNISENENIKIIQELKNHLDTANSETKKLQKECEQFKQRLHDQASTIETQEIELSTLENLKFQNGDEQTISTLRELKGKIILYVGGRQRSMPHIQSIIESSGACFLSHDGGLEKSIDELASLIKRSDVVVFPTDCVSHEAMNKVKLLCQRLSKTYQPVRTSGVSSLVIALNNLDQPSCSTLAAE